MKRIGRNIVSLYMSVLILSRSCISDGFSNHHDIVLVCLFILVLKFQNVS